MNDRLICSMQSFSSCHHCALSTCTPTKVSDNNNGTKTNIDPDQKEKG